MPTPILKRKLVKPPHYCNRCDEQLIRIEVVNVKTGRDCGHTWKCLECQTQYIGFGDPHEYPNLRRRKAAK